MPLYNLLWSTENGPGGEPSSASTQIAASAPEKAAEKALALRAVVESEIEGYAFSWEELDEDGEVVARG